MARFDLLLAWCASLRVNQKTHFVWIFFVLWAKYFVREIIWLQLHSINLYWNNLVPKNTGNPCKYLLSCSSINENQTHSSHLFQCLSEKPYPRCEQRPFDLPRYIRASARRVEKPCTKEKRFTNKILDYSQLLSSTLNIIQEGCEKLQRVQAQRSLVPGERKVLHLLHIEPAYYGHFLWSPECLY